MLKRTFQASILFVTLSSASFPAAVNQSPIDNCEAKESYYRSYENSPIPVAFLSSELWRVIDCNRDDISAVSTIVIAVFTIVLGLFTISLAKSTRRAARVAERALSELERPWVVLEGVRVKRREIGNQRSIPNNWFVELRFKNIGRSPAVIEACPFGIAPKDKLPNCPEYNTNLYLLCQRHVGAGDSFETAGVGPHEESDIILVMYGKISYRELMGSGHETGFAIEVSPQIAAYSPYDRPHYQYYT